MCSLPKKAGKEIAFLYMTGRNKNRQNYSKK